MNDLAAKLPAADGARNASTSDLTLCGVLGVLYELLRANSTFTKKFVEEGGVDKLMHIVKQPQEVRVGCQFFEGGTVIMRVL